MTTLETTPTSSPSELPGTSPMTPVPARLISIEKETHDTYTLTLEPPAAQGAEFTSRFRPGQFSMLYDFGVGELQVGQTGHVPNFLFRDLHACAFFRDAL